MAKGKDVADLLTRKNANINEFREVNEAYYSALRGMCSMWETVCRSKGWEPEHVHQYVRAITEIEKLRGE